MARTSKKAKAVAVAAVMDTATDAEIRNVGEVAIAEAETVADTAGVAENAVSAPEKAVEIEPAPEAATGTDILIPLNRLKKSPRNARKTPHSEAHIEALEAPEPEADEGADGDSIIDGVRVNADGEIIEDGGYDEDGNHAPALDAENEEADEDGKPISDLLIRDLTAHRTLGLRLALGEQPDMALIAVTHALAAQTFYLGMSAHALEIRPASAHLGEHADGIEDTAAAKALADRHDGWAADMPQDVADLWGFVAGLDQASLMALFAHCASLTVNALKLPWEQNKRRAHATADRLATALVLDMTTHWTPTVSTYLGRVTKAHILAAVRESVGDEAAERLSGKKKQEMAEAAEQLLAGTGWLPPLLRTERPAWLDAPQTDAGTVEAEAAAETSDATEAAEPEALASHAAELDRTAFHVAAE